MHLTQLEALCLTIEDMYPEYSYDEKCKIIGRAMYRVVEDRSAKSDNLTRVIFCASRGLSPLTHEEIAKKYDYNLKRIREG